MSKDLVCQEQEIKHNNAIKQYYIKKKEDIKEHNPNWLQIPDHPNKVLIAGGNVLLNLINYQPDIDKIYLYSKDPYEAKYQLLISKIESTEFKCFNDS